MATPILAKSPHPEDSYDGNLIPELIDLVKQAEKPKPPQPAPAPTEDPREKNARMLIALWQQGEQMAAQAFELPLPKPDPLTIALNGFPDFASSQAYYAGHD